uniref:Alpha-tubulin N-acetyltransferase n=1 Tax=Steinernema glaseri TaxID=37863 RepID=A0A1I7ZQX9_9BILA
MEVKADFTPMLGPSLVRLDPMRVKQLQNETLYQAIDELCKMSAQAMNLKCPLTTCEKLIISDNTVYLAWERDHEKAVSRLIGILKVGRKKLFLYDNDRNTYEGELICLLDFYVHHSAQRQGYGKALFDFMLQSERAKVERMAFDSPTVTLLAFLNKHYDLSNAIWQNTNFVVFPQLFECIQATKSRWLESAISGHQSKGHGQGNPIDADTSTEGTLANRANQAKQRKAHILSSKPLCCILK